jgi:hypothetical protein
MTPPCSTEISIIAHLACLSPTRRSKARVGTPRFGRTRRPLALLTPVYVATLLAMSAGIASAQWTDATCGPPGDTGHGFGVVWGGLRRSVGSPVCFRPQ